MAERGGDVSCWSWQLMAMEPADPLEPPSIDGVGDTSEHSPPPLLAQLWYGDVRLPVAFWGWGVGGAVLLRAVLALSHRPAVPFAPLWFLEAAFFVFMMIAIWRSAGKYGGDRSWSVLARITVLVEAARLLVILYARLRHPI